MEKEQIIRNVMKNGRVVPKPDYRDLGAILLFIFLFPYIISFFFNRGGPQQRISSIEDGSYIVCNTTAAGTEKMPLETYLILRLPVTIDAEYEPEALKAQAVVLRTELMRAYYENEKENKINENTKKYIYEKNNVIMADGDIYDKCRRAVEDTSGMYMCYEGYPIMAPYFAISSGATRNGSEVLNSAAYPYLKSVRCERDFSAPEYARTVRINQEAFLKQLKTIYPEDDLKKEDIEEIMLGQRDRADYVTAIGVGARMLSGETFREIFSLNSSCFTIEHEKNNILLKTKGMGHGLGMSQFAANEAAKRGSDFVDILNYFFTDIVIEKTE